MSSLSNLQQFVPWIAAVSSVGGAIMLTISIRNLLHMLKASDLARVPLKEQQQLTFPMAGPVVLCVEGPLLTRRFAALSFILEAADGAAVPSQNNWFRATSSSFSKVRMQLQTYWLPHPGCYLLRIQPLGDYQPDDAEHAIIFVKPHLTATFGYILGIIFAAWLLLGGIVFFALNINL